MKCREESDILAERYTKIAIEKENGELVAEITNYEITPATGYLVKLTPKYD